MARSWTGSSAALARFGLGLLPDDADGLAFRADWLATAVRFLLRPGALDADLVVRFEVPGPDGPQVLQLRLGPTGAAVDPDGAPDLVLAGDPAALVTALRDPARAQVLAEEGRLTVTGSAADRTGLAGALGRRSADVGDLEQPALQVEAVEEVAGRGAVGVGDVGVVAGAVGERQQVDLGAAVGGAQPAVEPAAVPGQQGEDAALVGVEGLDGVGERGRRPARG